MDYEMKWNLEENFSGRFASGGEIPWDGSLPIRKRSFIPQTSFDKISKPKTQFRETKTNHVQDIKPLFAQISKSLSKT